MAAQNLLAGVELQNERIEVGIISIHPFIINHALFITDPEGWTVIKHEPEAHTQVSTNLDPSVAVAQYSTPKEIGKAFEVRLPSSGDIGNATQPHPQPTDAQAKRNIGMTRQADSYRRIQLFGGERKPMKPNAQGYQIAACP